MKRYNKISNLVLLAVTLAIVFLFLEITVRFFFQHPKYDKVLTDIWYLGIPGKEGTFRTSEFEASYKYNSLGFRDNEYNITKGEKCRIVAIGDSFTEAYQMDLDNTWEKILERKINAEVMNFGMTGTGTAAQFFVARDYAIKFNPDILLLVFYTFNDVADNYVVPIGKHFRLEGVNLVEVPIEKSKIMDLARRSNFLSAIKKN